MSADPIGPVTRHLLVRHLASWVPDALRRSRRATFVQAYAGPDGDTAGAALRALGRAAGGSRGRQLTVLTVVGPTDDLLARHAALAAELPAEVTAHPVAGDLTRLPVVLKAAAAAAAPLFGYLDAVGGPPVDGDVLAAVVAGRPAELLLVLDPAARAGGELRQRLNDAGFPLVSEVELVVDPAPGPPGRGGRLLVFATAYGKRLEAFKDALWTVDRESGVRFRDPHDPEGRLVDPTPVPAPEPLRHELLDRLTSTGPASVTQLRQFTAERTVYRAGDANQVLEHLVASGEVNREPLAGRLSGDTMITVGAPAG
ncbi:hypothetical protein [Plantactinospora sp. B5E13]|uniref:hypothetical protein n=1 Tax=unclassified Plantactinospora TaxID=2631981 RepID=UPI00325E249B